MSVYTVKSVWNNPREWTSKQGGTFMSYKVDLTEADGTVAMGVEWNKKVDSPAPQVGEQVAGHTEEGTYGPKFKIDYEATKELRQSGSPGPSRESGGGATGGHMKPKPPEENARMSEAHAQEMALRWFELHSSAPTDAELVERIEYFAGRVEAAGKKAAKQGTPEPQAGQVTSPPSASPASQNPDQELDEAAHQIGDKLADLGVISINLRDHLVKAWKELPNEKRTVAEAALVMGDERTQSEALKRLKDIAGPLPEIPADMTGLGEAAPDDIPFRRPEYTELFTERERRRF